jgi:hypothetical protein
MRLCALLISALLFSFFAPSVQNSSGISSTFFLENGTHVVWTFLIVCRLCLLHCMWYRTYARNLIIVFTSFLYVDFVLIFCSNNIISFGQNWYLTPLETLFNSPTSWFYIMYVKIYYFPVSKAKLMYGWLCIPIDFRAKDFWFSYQNFLCPTMKLFNTRLGCILNFVFLLSK